MRTSAELVRSKARIVIIELSGLTNSIFRILKGNQNQEHNGDFRYAVLLPRILAWRSPQIPANTRALDP